MKTNYLFPVLALVVTLMSLVVLSGCQPEQTAVAAALTNSAAPQAVFNPEVRAYEQYRAQRTAAAEAVSFHAIDPVDMKLFNYVETSMDSADLSAYRWNAMARGY
ncbi:MAG: hypothetical protein ACK2UK_06560, partial [Candidatus Promineifilaceae bacterium]